MACEVQIKDGPKLSEAEFYNWLYDNLDRLQKEGKLNMDEVRKARQMRESSEKKTSVREFIKITVKGLGRMISAAKKLGEKEGAKATKESISELQKAAYQYLKDVGIKPDLNISRLISKLRTPVNFARFVDAVMDKHDKLMFLIGAEKAQKAIDKLLGLGNEKRLTVGDLKYLKGLTMIDPLLVSNPDEYRELVENLLNAKKGGKSTSDGKKKLQEYLDKENKRIATEKRRIYEFNEWWNGVQTEIEYDTLKDSGIFDATDIKSLEDYRKLKERIENDEEDSPLVQKIKKTKEEKRQSVIDNIMGFVEENGALITQNGGEFSNIPITRDSLAVLSYDDLVLMNNVLQNIAYNGDISNAYRVFGQIKQKGKFAKLIEVLGGRKLWQPVTGFASKFMTKSLIFDTMGMGEEVQNALSDFIRGNWKGAHGSVLLAHVKVANLFNKFYDELGKTNEQRKKSLSRIQAYAFINQWFEDLTTPEEINAHFLNRVETLAANAKFWYDNKENDFEYRNASDILDALQDFGVIDDLVKGPESVSFNVKQDISPETIEGKLRESENLMYRWMLKSFEDLKDTEYNITSILGRKYRKVTNYFPTFTKKNPISKGEADGDPVSILEALNGFAAITKVQGVAKERSDRLADINNRLYSLDIRDSFEKGYWQALLVNNMSREIMDMVNTVMSKNGIGRLHDLGIGVTEIEFLKKILSQQVINDMQHTSINNSDLKVLGEVWNTLKENFANMILRNPAQLFKQSSGLMSNFLLAPEASLIMYKFRSRSDNTELATAIDNLFSKTDAYARISKYLEDVGTYSVPKERLKKYEEKVIDFIRSRKEAADFLSDGITPAVNLTWQNIFGKDGEVIKGSLLTYTDAKMSMINILVGYIRAAQRDNKNWDFEQIKNHLLSGEINSRWIQEAERWNERLNAASNKNESAQITKETWGKMFYFMGKFSLETHQRMISDVRALSDPQKMLDMTPNEITEKVKNIAAYVVMQATFQLIAQYLLNALWAKWSGDDDDEYTKARRLGSVATGVGTDIFMSSLGWIGRVASVMLSNYAWRKMYIEPKSEGLTKTEVREKGIDKPLSFDQKMGPVSMQLINTMYEATNDFVSRVDELEKANISFSEYKEMFYSFGELMLALGMGSGPMNRAALATKKNERKHIRILSALNAEGNVKGVQFHLDPEDTKKIVEYNADSDPLKFRMRTFVELGEDAKPKYLYILDDKNYYIRNLPKVLNMIAPPNRAKGEKLISTIDEFMERPLIKNEVSKIPYMDNPIKRREFVIGKIKTAMEGLAKLDVLNKKASFKKYKYVGQID